MYDIEDKRDDRDDDQRVSQQVFICNHPTTSFWRRYPSAASGAPQGHTAKIILPENGQKRYLISVKNFFGKNVTYWHKKLSIRVKNKKERM